MSAHRISLVSRLLAVTALSAGFGVGLAGGTASAEEAPRAASAVDEVVVTATRRATNVQETPIAISAVGGQALENHDAVDLFSAAPYLPGVSINGTAGYGNFPLGIRGIASSTSLIGSDDPVAVYIDGVYVGKPSAALAEMLDVDHLEIVRGPQGTLYGRNATAGALLVVHKEPTSAPDISMDASYGSFGRWRLDGRVAGPIAGEQLAGSLALSHTDMSGWGTNTVDGSKVVRREATSGVGDLVMRTGDLKAVLRADYIDEKVHDGLKKLNAIPYVTANPIVADSSLKGEPDTYAFNFPTQYHRTDGGVSLNAELSLDGGLVVHSVTGYRHDLLDGSIDTDGTAANLNTNRTNEQLDQFSQTLYATGGGAWGTWIAGLDLYKGLTRLHQTVGAPAAASSLDIFSANDTTSGGLFAEVTRKFTETLSLTAGGRLSSESKRFDYRTVGVGIFPSTPYTPLQKTWSAFSPSVRLSYEPSRDVLAYLSVSTGFKSGGFTALQAGAFDPERVVTYEAGAKTTLADGRVTLNGDVYYSDYKNLQVRIPVSVGVIQTLNAASATIKGVEVEGAWRATDQLSFSAFANYTDARYGNYVGPGNIQNSGQRLNRAPKWQGGGTARYDQPVDGGLLSGELTLAYRSQIYFSAPNLPGLGSPAYSQLDARLAYELA
ncbi:MAG: TonB-dependent receptor, partial [Caulobacteraceae bacterium]|nr:TonB-dependent receptor [Caulobacteraceae bacterium]